MYKKFNTVAKNYHYEIIQMEQNKDNSIYCNIFKDNCFIGDCNITYLNDTKVSILNLNISRGNIKAEEDAIKRLLT